MTPTLPDTLARLAELLPERIKMANGFIYTFEAEGWRCVGETADLDAYVLGRVQLALQEECGARGWRWGVYQRYDDYRATVEHEGHWIKTEVAPTAAHALGLALALALIVIAALEAT